MLTEIYFEIDEFCKKNAEIIQKWLKESGLVKKNHPSKLSLSETMTILLYYHLSYYKDFKHYYNLFVSNDLRVDFPDLVSYNRFVELIPRATFPMLLFLQHRCSQSKKTGIYFIDSTPVEVCHPKRAHSHKVMRAFSGWGKTSVGWFYGLKVHLITNQFGELMNVSITTGSTPDNDLKRLYWLTKNLMGWLFGDKGYILKEEKQQLIEDNGRLKLFTKHRKNMKKNVVMPVEARLWLRKRGVIESVIEITKHACDLAHARHRSSHNAFVNMLSSLCSYTFIKRKPSTSIKLEERLLSAPESLGLVG